MCRFEEWELGRFERQGWLMLMGEGQKGWICGFWCLAGCVR